MKVGEIVYLTDRVLTGDGIEGRVVKALAGVTTERVVVEGRRRSYLVGAFAFATAEAAAADANRRIEKAIDVHRRAIARLEALKFGCAPETPSGLLELERIAP